MGTRHLITVVCNGQTKIAQYGQWDGYPSGQGVTVLKFLANKKRIAKLKSSMKRVRFLDHEGVDKEMIEEYEKNAPMWSTDRDDRTDAQATWFKTLISRNLGAKILDSVANSKGEVLLNDDSDFSEDSGCEYEYIVDLDKNVLSVLNDVGLMGVYKLDNLPTKKEFLTELGR